MIRISASYQKKVPADQEFSSQSFHAGLEVELPDAVVAEDASLKRQLHGMFQSLKEAVDEQLANGGNGEQPKSGGNGSKSNGSRSNGNGNGVRKATKAQIRAIHAISKRLGEHVADLVHERFNVDEPDALSIREASSLIEDLKERADS